MLSSNLRRLRKERRMTLDELAAATGVSKQTVHRYENGVISNVPREKVELLAAALGVSPTELMGWDDEKYSAVKGVMPVSLKRIPIIGEIACGKPIYTNEEYGNFAVTDESVDASFCLRAHGDSMTGARIYDGDIVFIRAQDTVENGEIAAVVINDEATLKRVYYYPEEGKLILSPENPHFAPMVYVKEELNSIKIIGKAVAFQSTVR